jgi:hypothetical protein
VTYSTSSLLAAWHRMPRLYSVLFSELWNWSTLWPMFKFPQNINPDRGYWALTWQQRTLTQPAQNVDIAVIKLMAWRQAWEQNWFSIPPVSNVSALQWVWKPSQLFEEYIYAFTKRRFINLHTAILSSVRLLYNYITWDSTIYYILHLQWYITYKIFYAIYFGIKASGNCSRKWGSTTMEFWSLPWSWNCMHRKVLKNSLLSGANGNCIYM